MPTDINILHRKKLVEALPPFMNTCEGGACGCTGSQASKPTEFERASLDAMEAIQVIKLAPYHESQKRAVLNLLHLEIEAALRFIR